MFNFKTCVKWAFEFFNAFLAYIQKSKNALIALNTFPLVFPKISAWRSISRQTPQSLETLKHKYKQEPAVEMTVSNNVPVLIKYEKMNTGVVLIPSPSWQEENTQSELAESDHSQKRKINVPDHTHKKYSSPEESFRPGLVGYLVIPANQAANIDHSHSPPAPTSYSPHSVHSKSNGGGKTVWSQTSLSSDDSTTVRKKSKASQSDSKHPLKGHRSHAHRPRPTIVHSVVSSSGASPLLCHYKCVPADCCCLPICHPTTLKSKRRHAPCSDHLCVCCDRVIPANCRHRYLKLNDREAKGSQVLVTHSSIGSPSIGDGAVFVHTHSPPIMRDRFTRHESPVTQICSDISTRSLLPHMHNRPTLVCAEVSNDPSRYCSILEESSSDSSIEVVRMRR